MRTVVEKLVYRSCLLLDDLDFEGFLSLCDADFRYILQAYAQRFGATWCGSITIERACRHYFATYRAPQRSLAFNPPRDRVHGDVRRTEHTGHRRVRIAGLSDGPGRRRDALFAVGKLHDTVNLAGGSALLARRAIRLDTRQLGIGGHIPL